MAKTGPKPKLTNEIVREIAKRYLAGETQESLAVEYGVSVRSLNRALNHRGVDRDLKVSGPAMSANSAKAFYEQIGDPPSDPLGAVGWLQQVLIASAKQALADPEYTGKESKRRKELRDIATAVKGVLSPAVIFEAKKLIEGDSEDMKKTMIGPKTHKRKRK